MISSVRSLQHIGAENVVTALTNSPAHMRVAKHGVPVKSVGSFSPGSFWAFKQLSFYIKPDVVITYGGPETIISMFLAGGLKAKFYRFRGQPPEGNGFFGQVLQDSSHRHVDTIIVPSMAVLRLLSPNCQMKSQIIPLGVDAEKYTRSTDSHNDSRPELLIFGRLDPVKGHEKFFRIFKIMLERWAKDAPRPVLKIVGREENVKVASLEKIRSQLGIDPVDVIYVPKQIDNAAAVMTAATLGIIPSLGSEFICRVAHEFLLCGTPIFVSGAGALNEVCLDASTHSYLGMDDEQAAKKLLYLLQDSYLESAEVRSKRSLAARNAYSIEAMSVHFQAVLSGL
jgi:glycosyltransferase involved in cell wall biosynthesis